VERAKATPIGCLCLKLRRDEITSNMLEDKSNLNFEALRSINAP
jgi:hypothetical protein